MSVSRPPSRRPITVFKRGRSWAFRRAVPGIFSRVEQRRVITRSLAAKSERQARAEAEHIWQTLCRQWEALLGGESMRKRYKQKVAQAEKLLRGEKYLSADNVARLPREELFHRIRCATNADGELDPERGTAFLGGIPKPRPTLQHLLEEHFDEISHLLVKKSADQRRRIVAEKKRVIRAFIRVVGNKVVHELGTTELVEFSDWLTGRMNSGQIAPRTLNNYLFRLHGILRSGTRRLGLPLHFDLRDFKRQRVRGGSRPSFSEDWIRYRLLDPVALAQLDGEARAVLLGMINTGYRLSEGANLHAEQIRLDGRIPYLQLDGEFRPLKTANSRRKIPLTGVSLEAFRLYPKGFPSWRDRPRLSAVLNDWMRNKGLRETPKHTVHSLRHSFEDRLRRAGADERTRAELMGHKTERVRYGGDAFLPEHHALILSIAF